MDLDTFILAISEIALTIYTHYYDEQSQRWMPRNRKGALLQMINNNLFMLDNQIQMTEKGSDS